MELAVEWLGRMDYRAAWTRQHAMVALRAAGEIPDTLLLLEHPPVLTLGRQADPGFVRASEAELAERGIELIRVERGGEVTYHGPGQLVAYPIIRLADRQILLRPFVRVLEAAMAETCAAYGVIAGRRDGHPGCWVDPDSPTPRKIGALGIRVERGVSYHGIALNVTTNLEDFALIDPCGMPTVVVTSIAAEAGWPDVPRAGVREATEQATFYIREATEQATFYIREATDPTTYQVRVAAEWFTAAFSSALDAAGGVAGAAPVSDTGSATRRDHAAAPTAG